MRRLTILVCSIILFLGCRATKEEMDSSVVISMQKTKCYGPCPEYTLDIYESGKVFFVGRENVDKIGEFEIKLSKKELNRLVDMFLQHNFFGLNEQYTSGATDLPTTYIYFAHNGKRKTVVDYDNAPPRLKKLEEEVSELIKIPKWKQVSGSN